MLRGTSAVVFKGGESINHLLSLRWRSANSAPLTVSGRLLQHLLCRDFQISGINNTCHRLCCLNSSPVWSFCCTALSLLSTVELSLCTFFPFVPCLLAETLIPVENLLEPRVETRSERDLSTGRPSPKQTPRRKRPRMWLKIEKQHCLPSVSPQKTHFH